MNTITRTQELLPQWTTPDHAAILYLFIPKMSQIVVLHMAFVNISISESSICI